MAATPSWANKTAPARNAENCLPSVSLIGRDGPSWAPAAFIVVITLRVMDSGWGAVDSGNGGSAPSCEGEAAKQPLLRAQRCVMLGGDMLAHDVPGPGRFCASCPNGGRLRHYGEMLMTRVRCHSREAVIMFRIESAKTIRPGCLLKQHPRRGIYSACLAKSVW